MSVLYFSPGSHAMSLFSLLSVAGEIPLSVLPILGNARTLRTLVLKMTQRQTVRHTETGETVTARLLTVSGKGADRTVRIYKGALPILDWLGAKEHYLGSFDRHRFRGDAQHRERNHRVAEALSMCLSAGIEYRPYRVPSLQNERIAKTVPERPVFYPARQMKQIGVGEGNKTMFTRVVGALFGGGSCYAVYNTRNAVMKWNGMGEYKSRFALTEVARLNADIGQVDAAILFGNSYEVALKTLTEADRDSRREYRFDGIYRHIHFVPMDQSGVGTLRLLTSPDSKERLLDLLFEPADRSYDRGHFEYDAYIDGKYIFSFLDGDIARLARFYKVLEDGTTVRACEVLCFPSAVAFIRAYLGDAVSVKTIAPEEIEKAWNP